MFEFRPHPKILRFSLVLAAFSVSCAFFVAPRDALAQNVSVVVDDGQDAPPDDSLSDPSSGLDKASPSDDEGDVVISGPSAVHSGADQEVPDIGSDAFFDAEALVPQGEMSKQGPKRVNPALQPASKLITVRKNAGPDAVSSQLVSAERALSLGLNDSALEMFDALYLTNRRDPRVLMGRAVAFQNLGQFDEAMRAYEELEALDPRNVDVKVNMLGLLATKYPAIALRRLVELREQHPTHVGVVAQLAVTEANVGDFESALKHLGVAASMEPNNASHIFNMAVIADRVGQTSTAISFYEQALEVDTVYGSGRSVPRDAIYERLANIR